MEGHAAIVIIGSEPTDHNGRIESINAIELLVRGEVSAGSDSDVVTMGKEEDHGNEANAVLVKEDLDHVAIGIVRDGVLRVWETEVLIIIIIIVIIGCALLGVIRNLDKISCQGEAITKHELGKREVGRFIVPVRHIVEKSSHMEDATGDVEGDGVNGVERVA